MFVFCCCWCSETSYPLTHIASFVAVLINDALSVPWKATMQQPGAIHSELDERNMSSHTLMTLVRKMVYLPTFPPRKLSLESYHPQRGLCPIFLGESCCPRILKINPQQHLHPQQYRWETNFPPYILLEQCGTMDEICEICSWVSGSS